MCHEGIAFTKRAVNVTCCEHCNYRHLGEKLQRTTTPFSETLSKITEPEFENFQGVPCFLQFLGSIYVVKDFSGKKILHNNSQRLRKQKFVTK